MDWWRSWHGAPIDPKWLAVAKRAEVPVHLVVSVAWCMFDHASQAETRGTIDGFDFEGIAAFLGASDDEISNVYAAMDAVGIIHDDFVVSWGKRQPIREDESRNRTREWRERKQPVTHGDASVTHCDAPDKIRLDKKERKSGANAPLVFDGMVIKLNERDHTLWKQTFIHVELDAYLVSRDQFLASLAEDDNRRLKWMVSTSADLRNKNQEAKSSRKPNSSTNGKLRFRPEPAKISNEEWKKIHGH